MKLNAITDPNLREWVHKHIEAGLAERKAAKKSAEGKRDIWRTYNEADWGALRELIDLRATVAMREIEPSVVEIAIQRRIASLPRVAANGTTYTAPYSMGLEVAVLRELLGIEHRPSPRVTVTELVDFHA